MLIMLGIVYGIKKNDLLPIKPQPSAIEPNALEVWTSHSPDGQLVEKISCRLTTKQLLASADLEIIHIVNEGPYRNAPMQFKAVPLLRMLDSCRVHPNEWIDFIATDGYAHTTSYAGMASKKSFTAWVAIEDPKDPWPNLPGRQYSAGPFFLIWPQVKSNKNLEHTGIVKAPTADDSAPSRDWTYQLQSIRLRPATARTYPKTKPDSKIYTSDKKRRSILAGYGIYRAHCMSCHTVNGQGPATMGPDLNSPHNPVEYFTAKGLRMFIRDPKQLRSWPKARMKGFDVSRISEENLDHLIAYLEAKSLEKKAL